MSTGLDIFKNIIEENEILKEGLKVLSKTIMEKNDVFYVSYYVINDVDDFKKVKAMLEVVEND